MPAQTTKKNIYFPDGAKVSVKPAGEASFFDIGALSSDITATLNYDENQIQTANADKTDKQIKNMTIEGSFTLINLDPEGVGKLGGGIFTIEETAGTTILGANISDQTIAAGWEENAIYPLEFIVDATGAVQKFSEAPVITSVKLDPGTINETLTVNSDYFVHVDRNSPSGYSISFISDNIVATGATGKEIVIDFGNNVPVANTTIYAGSSTAKLSAYAMNIEHTDDNGKKRSLDLYSVDANSGGFQFNFKGANSDGVEEMPLTFTAKLDTTKTNGKQLMAWSIDAGAM